MGIVLFTNVNDILFLCSLFIIIAKIYIELLPTSLPAKMYQIYFYRRKENDTLKAKILRKC